MRADRLVATLLLMQARGLVTATELARELETSVATARRDLEALSAAGIPVYPQAGRGGGWQLLGGARTDLSGLTSAEARALFLLVGPAAAVAPDAKSALRKLVRALPATFRADAEAAADAVVIDPARWGRTPREQPPVVSMLEEGVVRRRQVRLTYRGWQREPAERVVHPWGLVEKSGVWYLIGGVDGAQRTYRVDRIVDAELTDEAASRPVDFDLADAWDGVVRDVGEQRESVSAELVVDAEIVPFLRSQLAAVGGAVSVRTGPATIGGTGIEEPGTPDDPIDDRYASLTVSAPTETLLARALAGWAEYVTVRQPESLRTGLARIGRDAVVRNSPGGGV